MWNGQIPNDIEFSVFSDKRMCEILEADVISTLDLAMQNEFNVWKCPDCGRLYVFKNESDETGNKVLRVYKPEELP